MQKSEHTSLKADEMRQSKKVKCDVTQPQLREAGQSRDEARLGMWLSEARGRAGGREDGAQTMALLRRG
jgi:hypothetical protein